MGYHRHYACSLCGTGTSCSPQHHKFSTCETDNNQVIAAGRPAVTAVCSGAWRPERRGAVSAWGVACISPVPLRGLAEKDIHRGVVDGHHGCGPNTAVRLRITGIGRVGTLRITTIHGLAVVFLHGAMLHLRHFLCIMHIASGNR